MAYSKKTWVDDVTPVSAANMNNIENGIIGLTKDMMKTTIMAEAQFYNHDNIVIDSYDDNSGIDDLGDWWGYDSVNERVSLNFGDNLMISQLVGSGNAQAYGQYHNAQTFKAIATGKLTKVDLKIFKNGSPGNITVSIKATTGSPALPTGSALASTTILEGNIPTTESWVSVTLPTPLSVTKDSIYAITISCTGVNTSNSVYWVVSGTSVYADGCWVSSADNGSTWTANTTFDLTFRVYMQPLSSTAIPITSVASTLDVSGDDVLFVTVPDIGSGINLTYEGSLDGGSNWTELTLDDIATFTAAGTSLVIKISATWNGVGTPIVYLYGWGASVGV